MTSSGNGRQPLPQPLTVHQLIESIFSNSDNFSKHAAGLQGLGASQSKGLQCLGISQPKGLPGLGITQPTKGLQHFGISLPRVYEPLKSATVSVIPQGSIAEMLSVAESRYAIKQEPKYSVKQESNVISKSVPYPEDRLIIADQLTGADRLTEADRLIGKPVGQKTKPPRKRRRPACSTANLQTTASAIGSIGFSHSPVPDGIGSEPVVPEKKKRVRKPRAPKLPPPALLHDTIAVKNEVDLMENLRFLSAISAKSDWKVQDLWQTYPQNFSTSSDVGVHTRDSISSVTTSMATICTIVGNPDNGLKVENVAEDRDFDVERKLNGISMEEINNNHGRDKASTNGDILESRSVKMSGLRKSKRCNRGKLYKELISQGILHPTRKRLDSWYVLVLIFT